MKFLKLFENFIILNFFEIVWNFWKFWNFMKILNFNFMIFKISAVQKARVDVNISYYYIRLYFTVFLLARSNTRDIPFSNILNFIILNFFEIVWNFWKFWNFMKILNLKKKKWNFKFLKKKWNFQIC
jgi:hypothetical protein